MTSKVTYKFKSARDFDHVMFSGNHISLADLTQKIVQKKGLSKNQSDFDLVLTNSATKEVYKGDDTKIPKNVQIIVLRVPSTYGVLAKLRSKKEQGGDAGAPVRPGGAAGGAESRGKAQDDFGGDVFDSIGPGGLDNDEDEDDAEDSMAEKLALLAQQRSRQAKDRMRKQQRGIKGMPQQQGGNNGRFNNGSYHQQQAQAARRANIGIPKNYLGKGGEGGGEEGESGTTAENGSAAPRGTPAWLKFQSDTSNFQQRVKERGGMTTRLSDDEVRKRISADDVPPELVCALTNTLLKDAMDLPCCKKTCSNEELERALVNSQFVCPLCNTPGIVLDRLKPNHQIRRKVDAFVVQQRDKLEADAAVAADRAAEQAERERQQKLLESQSYSRPDTFLDLSKKEDADTDKGDPAQQERDHEQQQAPPPEDAENGKDEDAENGKDDIGNDGDVSPAPAATSGWAQVINTSASSGPASEGSGNKQSPRFREPGRSPGRGYGPPPHGRFGGGPPPPYDDYYRRGPPPPYFDDRRRGGPRFDDGPPRDRFFDRPGPRGRFPPPGPYHDRGGYDYDDYRRPPPPMRRGRSPPPGRGRSPPRRMERSRSPRGRHFRPGPGPGPGPGPVGDDRDGPPPPQSPSDDDNSAAGASRGGGGGGQRRRNNKRRRGGRNRGGAGGGGGDGGGGGGRRRGKKPRR